MSSISRNSEDLYLTPQGVEYYFEMNTDEDICPGAKELMNLLPKGSRILELGMGDGRDYNFLRESYDVTGSDYSEYFIKKAEENFPLGDFRILNAIEFKLASKVDCIYSNKVLHHLSKNNLEQSIRNQSEALNDEGIICHSFWRGNEKIQKGSLHFNKYLETEVENFFSDQFETIKLIRYGEYEGGDQIVYIGRKKDRQTSSL